MKALQADLIKRFADKMDHVDSFILKKELISESLKMFI